MKITSMNQSAWYSTESIFGKIDPQPEIQLRPMPRNKKIEFIEEATQIKMIAHPEKPGQFLQAEYFNKFAFAQATLNFSIVGFKHFEKPDGTPCQPTPEDIDYLLESLGDQFEKWLQELIQKVNESRLEESEKNS